MPKLIPIKTPRLNPNEAEALFVSLEVSEGDPIEKGQVVAVIETTKSTGEVEANNSGYLVGLRYKAGDTVRAGETLAYIGDSPTAQDPTLSPWASKDTEKQEELSGSAGLRITAPARELALEEGFDLESLPRGPLVTKQLVKEYLIPKTPPSPIEIPQDENRILIYGAGGHGRSLADMILTLGTYEIMGFLDDGYEPGEVIFGNKVLGGAEKLSELAEAGVRLAINGVGGIGDLASRLRVYELLRGAGFHCPTVVHPTAFVEASAVLSDGVQIFPFAYVGTDVKVGYGAIINTSAIVSHECNLAPYINLSPGATLAGGVTIEQASLVGMRATINLGVHVGWRARIGNGATVKADVPDSGVVPAGTIWPPHR